MFELFPIADPVPWPFAGIFWPIATTITVYLIFVLKLGPMVMANREPFNLRGVLKVYNLFQVIFNILLVLWGLHAVLWKRPYPDFSCIMTLPFDHEMKNTERMIGYLYYVNKIIDLLDTVFFVLRKSYKQITKLHLIHHVYMASASYFFTRLYGYGGHFLILAGLNTITHIAMYAYYYLSSQNPNIKQSIWWKQYITILQMVQFVMMFSHSFWTLMQPECEVPFLPIFIILFMSGVMFVMFSDFYIKAYLKKKTT
ncbi:elongation of very long chain fatty acids protein F-like [Drosophila albomicans]|uniref:Elongation of very long chain fatty acids protein n=1 Tax=Drosophila albomicans TaxID=7291 RepID=A0A6P8ZEP4_DROAB|nr:elongation of very long chain fatty acids protein F-like [Drosophila albomicans]